MTRTRRGRPRDPMRVIGSCWACRGPVRVFEAVRVPDPVVTFMGRPIRRLAHRGECEAEVRARLSEGR